MPAGHDPKWPDKAMFSAILLVLAGFVGLAFELARPLLEVNQDRMPSLFTDDIPYYTSALCALMLLSGILSLRHQAAVFAYVGAVLGILSLGVFGLVPGLALVAIGFMVKSHIEGEETHLDEHEVAASAWPDKAMAASLLAFVASSIALTQGVLILAGRFNAIVWPSDTLAGWLGVVSALFGFVAAHELYHLRRPWLGWTALVLGLATLGFYLIGPILALTGLLLLALAHREDEFRIHGTDGGPDAPTAAPKRTRRGRRRRRPTAT